LFVKNQAVIYANTIGSPGTVHAVNHTNKYYGKYCRKYLV